MAVEHINRRGQKYYLHQGITKTGKPKYLFSMKSEGMVQTIPDGFEIYENPNAQVFLQRIQPKIITDDEIATVDKGIKKFSHLQCLIDIKKDIIYIYIPSISYSAMLRFILFDDIKRIFMTERFCSLGSIDDWIGIGGSDTLQKLVEKYVKHLGKESFYELH